MAHRQVAELHLDERLEKSREVIGERVAAGQAKVSTAYNKLWADIEAMRKAQRERQEEQRAAAEKLRLEQEKQGIVPEPAGKCESTRHATLTTSLISSQGKHKPQTSVTRVPAPAHTSPPGARGPARSAKAGATAAPLQTRHPPPRPHLAQAYIPVI